MTKKKERIDTLLVKKGLETSRTRARARILAGDVIVNDHRVDKAGSLVSVDAKIRLKGEGMPYVSRGALKLESAIENWPTDIKGKTCLDVGASTGGFTEILLKHGASHVFAVDVGYGQLAWKLRNDPRVTNLERTHILKLKTGFFSPPPTIAVIDVSFISLTRVLPGVLPHLNTNARIYILIKPQFEVGRKNIEKGGIVRDQAAREQSVEKVLSCARTLGLKVLGVAESPIKGAMGNVEFLAALATNSLNQSDALESDSHK